MSSQLYIGNGQATPSIVVEKHVPMPLSMQFGKDQNGKIIKLNIVIDIDGATDIDKEIFYSAYINMTSISGEIDFSSLEKISGERACYMMFSGCTGITSVKLSSLKNVSGNSACYHMFNNCTGISGHLNLSSLQTIGSNGFQDTFHGCTGITSVNLSSLETVGYYGLAGTFNGCTKIISVEFPSLKYLNNYSGYELYYCFYGCTSLKYLSFPALTSKSFGTSENHFTNYMLGNGVTGCEVHFPSNLESVIGSWSDVQAGFGGTNTQVLFDLPATE